ncbi:uncharacterized protein B0I36DRAFT_240341 [Microdochium trichocladiopsis]|uniref:Homeobox and C2H2 transcription factor n=1 Tax=Microdochium trichocladiopsis TaxID=1682393 RepID=A0A9P8YDR1_9PEZI|nr:uncharacterized protein B0I36DRAFT_240341 [Microdochium trichocladiopsis]KAH7036020.1 hypothetical protein B0I36DRAFT_240341 [Microdochium trichocladiopsis]
MDFSFEDFIDHEAHDDLLLLPGVTGLPDDAPAPPLTASQSFLDDSVLVDLDFDDDRPNLSLEAFFSSNGGWRPAVPCDHCRTRRLQCIMLQTTTVNPNPVMSCSSCAALFRSCSLAQKIKRQPSEFETPDPVIGQLHGVTEDHLLDFFKQDPTTTAHDISGGPIDEDSMSHKRAASRHVSRTKPLRTWLVAHSDNPYPTVEEKEQLGSATGLTAVQIANWFANARRRQRQTARAVRKQSHFSRGSPMPSPSNYSMSPMQRWRNSPPEQEGISVAAIERAIGTPAQQVQWLGQHSSGASSTSSLTDLDGYDSGSMMSCASSVSHVSSMSAFDDQSLASLAMSFNADELLVEKRPTRRQSRVALHACKTCLRQFKKRSDLTRHESTIHSATTRSWICSLPVPPDQSLVVWCTDSGTPQCLLCGCEQPDEAHLSTHEFDACAERSLPDRTFARKDHLWQHLRKFHGCKKWAGWKPELDILSHEVESAG